MSLQYICVRTTVVVPVINKCWHAVVAFSPVVAMKYALYAVWWFVCISWAYFVLFEFSENLRLFSFLILFNAYFMRWVEYCILYIEYRIEYCTELSFEYFMSFLWSLIGFVCIIWVHNVYPYFGNVATCYLLVRVCIHRPAAELSRVWFSGLERIGLYRLLNVPRVPEDQSDFLSGSACSDSQVILVFESAGEYRQWIGVDRLPSIPHRREDWIRPWCQPDLQQTLWVVH